MDRIRAITFDAFGTIVDTGRDALLRVAGRIVDDHRLDLAAAAFLERWDHYFFGIRHEPFLTLAEATRVSLADAFREFAIDTTPGPYVDLLQDEWMRAKAYPEVPAVLRALDGIPRAVVSNADDAMLKQILSENRLDFDAVITSESCRAYKPSARIFEVALERLGIPAPGVLHVGDSLEADIAGANAVGMRTAWVNRAGETRRIGDVEPDLVVSDLSDLVPRLRRSSLW